MLKVLLITYYGIKEALYGLASGLSKLGYVVENFSLYQYANDVHDKRDDYVSYFDQVIKEKNPDIIFWWCVSTRNLDDFETISQAHSHRLQVFFNWDDPHSLQRTDLFIREKARNFDLVLTSCEESTRVYLDQGVKKAIFMAPGVDDTVFRPVQINPAHACDVSFITTNLYADESQFPNQIINRKNLVDMLVNQKDFSFFLYGPDFLKELYPINYKGYAKYSDQASIMSSSKICLCTHVVGNQNIYVNERTNIIMACGGLLLVDAVKGIENLYEPGKDMVLIDVRDPIGQIKNILENYEEYQPIRKRAADVVKQNYTWEKFSEKTHVYISELLMKWEVYAKRYSLSLEEVFDEASALKHYLEKGQHEKYFTYPIEIPSNFDWKVFMERNALKFQSAEQAWIFWKQNHITNSKLKSGKIISTISSSSSSSPSSSSLFTDTENTQNQQQKLDRTLPDPGVSQHTQDPATHTSLSSSISLEKIIELNKLFITPKQLIKLFALFEDANEAKTGEELLHTLLTISDFCETCYSLDVTKALGIYQDYVGYKNDRNYHLQFFDDDA